MIDFSPRSEASISSDANCLSDASRGPTTSLPDNQEVTARPRPRQTTPSGA